MDKIGETTRRDIASIFQYGIEIKEGFENKKVLYPYYGRLDEIPFLKRIYNLSQLPSNDSRFANAEGDIWQHTRNNSDYEEGWVFEDERFELLSGTDEAFLRFLCAVFHPAVRAESGAWRDVLNEVNGLLRNDGYELYPDSKISGKDVYGWHMYQAGKKLTQQEIGMFMRLFNRNGYVLDFTTNEFDVFTMESIGTPLCAKYKNSKGKSLVAYISEADDSDVIKLLKDLLKHYEEKYEPEYSKENDEDAFGYSRFNAEYSRTYEKCKEIMRRISGDAAPLAPAAAVLKGKFSSGYLTAQIDLMIEMQSTNPTEAIGKAKELIESCCKTILDENGVVWDKNWDVGQLTGETLKLLKLMPRDIPETAPAAAEMKALLGNLRAIATNVAALRNPYGSGHGKSASYKGLEERHAKLAVGCSITLVGFLWDTHERKLKP